MLKEGLGATGLGNALGKWGKLRTWRKEGWMEMPGGASILKRAQPSLAWPIEFQLKEGFKISKPFLKMQTAAPLAQDFSAAALLTVQKRCLGCLGGLWVASSIPSPSLPLP